MRFSVPFTGNAVFLTTLKTMRHTGAANQYTVLDETAPLPVTDTSNRFDVRIPIEAGDLLGARGLPAALLCQTGNTADAVGIIYDDLEPGQAATFEPYGGFALPVVATVEPDGDGDGYGDDSQDVCARSASTEAPCPVITLDSIASAKRRSILVAVSADHPAQVTVTASAKVKGKKLRLEGGTRNVKVGTLGRFTVRYPKALRAAVAALPPGRTITVTLTANTTDVLGKVTSDTTRVRIARS